MTKDELKRKLHSYRNIKAEIIQVQEPLGEVESKMATTKAVNLNGMPNGSSDGDPMIGIVSQHLELQEKYKTLHAELVKQLSWIEETIAALDSRERRLMRYYYIQGMTWEQVCVAMNYSWKQIHRLHGNALAFLMSQCQEDGME